MWYKDDFDTDGIAANSMYFFVFSNVLELKKTLAAILMLPW